MDLLAHCAGWVLTRALFCGAGFLTYDEFRAVIGQDCLNFGFSEAESDLLIKAVDTGGKGAITYSDLSRRCAPTTEELSVPLLLTAQLLANRLATADLGRDHDAMRASSDRELQVRSPRPPLAVVKAADTVCWQSCRAHAARLADDAARVSRTTREADAEEAQEEVGGEAIGPLYKQAFSTSNASLGASAPGVGWGGKSQVGAAFNAGARAG